MFDANTQLASANKKINDAKNNTSTAVRKLEDDSKHFVGLPGLAMQINCYKLESRVCKVMCQSEQNHSWTVKLPSGFAI